MGRVKRLLVSSRNQTKIMKITVDKRYHFRKIVFWKHSRQFFILCFLLKSRLSKKCREMCTIQSWKRIFSLSVIQIFPRSVVLIQIFPTVSGFDLDFPKVSGFEFLNEFLPQINNAASVRSAGNMLRISPVLI